MRGSVLAFVFALGCSSAPQPGLFAAMQPDGSGGAITATDAGSGGAGSAVGSGGVIASTGGVAGAGGIIAPTTGGRGSGPGAGGAMATGGVDAGAVVGGAPGSGGVGSGGVPGNGGAAGTNGTEIDSGTASRSTDIYILIDQSASMGCLIGSGKSRWSALKSALESFAQAQDAATTISVGLGYFGTAASPPGSSCTPIDYQPDVEIGPLSVTASAIVNSLNNHNPLTDTPTLPALQSAISHAITWKAQHSDHMVAVVLVTDGQPNACGANTMAQVIQTASDGFKSSIPTYVIGIVSPGITCVYDPNKPTPADLDSVANAGGTNAALIVDTTSTTLDTVVQLTTSLTFVAH